MSGPESSVDTDLVVAEGELKKLKEANFGEALSSLLSRTTPEEVIRTRPGRGHQQFRYVTISWIIQQLNALFGFNWDFEILGHEIVDKKQIWVKGRLTVRSITAGREVVVTKTQYGGSAVKRLSNTQEIIDLANDLKSATSDCIKKCASLLGIAWDVYSGDREAMTEAGPKMPQVLAFYKRADKAGMTKDAADAWFIKQEDINPEGHAVLEAVEAEILGAIPKLAKMAKEKEEDG